MKRIVLADNMEYLPGLPGESIDLVYIDPPFNTGRRQSRTRIRARRDRGGAHLGFGGERYRTTTVGTKSFDDSFDDYAAFLEPRLREARRLLRPQGSFFLHTDFREAHYCKVLLDSIFGRECFMNEIIWAYDYGGRTRRRWSPKHDTILWYAKDPSDYTFNYDQIDRVPYMAPGLVGKEKAARGKTPTDVWWHTIVPTSGAERTGYPTQKPLGVLNRIVRVHSRPGDLLLDFFAGSGTLGEAAERADPRPGGAREFILVDNNPEAAEIMARRLAFAGPESVGFALQGPRRPSP